MYKSLIISLLCISSSVSSITHADIVVITNLDFPIAAMSNNDLRKLWLGKTKKITNVGRVLICDQTADKKITKQFYLHITNKRPNQVKAYWAKIQFIGKGFPPRQFDSDLDVMNWIQKTKNSIGYINMDSITDKMKILMTIKNKQ